jgi:hypothetical protein
LLSLGCLVFGASLLGIATRPTGFFAVFWPANALLAGLMVRRPELARASGWGAAALGYIAADLVTGNSLFATLWLTFSTLASAAVAAALPLRPRCCCGSTKPRGRCAANSRRYTC